MLAITRTRRAWLLLGLLTGTALVGCRAVQPDCPRLYSTDRLISTEIPDAEQKLQEEATAWNNVRDMSEKFSSIVGKMNQSGATQNYLALSGGGKYGAFTVGILKGWSDSGTRPCFDVVTGVSTGATIATFAYLGPQYDGLLLKYYQGLAPEDVLRQRRLLPAFFKGALADSGPLADTIAEVLTPQIIDIVAGEHRKGRGLYVGTTDLNTRKLVMWDMGAIAASNRPDRVELYRKIVLASASVPGYFPPVKIDVTINGQMFSEYHADGGATASAFFRTSMMDLPPGKPLYRAGSNLYIIVAGKRFAEPSCPGTRLTDVASNSISSMLYAASRNDLIRMFTLCLITGLNYNVASLPQSFRDSNNSLDFSPPELQRLIELGYTQARNNQAWSKLPPETSAEERELPRISTNLRLLRNGEESQALITDDGTASPPNSQPVISDFLNPQNNPRNAPTPGGGRSGVPTGSVTPPIGQVPAILRDPVPVR